MIEVRQLQKSFAAPRPFGRLKAPAPVQAVRGVDFTATDGRITGLLGPNGAGKTTTLRIVSGLIEADGGSAEIDGLSVAHERSRALARLGVLGDARGLYVRLTARENILYFARLQGVGEDLARQRLERLSQTLELGAILDRRTEGFSQGERMKTALARALIHDPPNIILDEPTNGLDVRATRGLREVLRRLRDEHGKCIVFSTHIMQEVERLCDEVVIVAHGRSLARGTPAELCAQAGQADFEEAFVTLAFESEAPAPAGARP